MKLYVTYSYGSNLRNAFSVVEGADIRTIYDEINRVCGPAYAFTYSEEAFEGQRERYGLHEVPLQAQVINK